MMAAIIKMHRLGLALAKLMMGIKAKAVRVALGLIIRHHSKSPMAASAMIISKVLVKVRSNKMTSRVISLLVMGSVAC